MTAILAKRDRGIVVGALDVDGQFGLRRIAVIVRQRVLQDEVLGLALGQRLRGRLGAVQHEGPASGGTQHQRAVLRQVGLRRRVVAGVPGKAVEQVIRTVRAPAGVVDQHIARQNRRQTMRVLGHRAAVVIDRQRAVVLDVHGQIARGRRAVIVRHVDRHAQVQGILARARMVDRRQQLHVVRIVPAAIVVQGNLDHVGHRDEMPEERDPDLARQRLAVARHGPVHFLAGRGQGLGRRAQLHRHRVSRIHVVDRERTAVLGAVGRVRDTRVIRDAGAVRRHDAALQAFFRDRRVRVGAVVAAEGDRRRVVRALDVEGQLGLRRVAVIVRQRVLQDEVLDLAFSQRLRGRLGAVQHEGPAAGGAQHQRTVLRQIGLRRRVVAGVPGKAIEQIVRAVRAPAGVIQEHIAPQDRGGAVRVLDHRAAVVIGRQRAVVLDVHGQIARGRRAVIVRHVDRHAQVQGILARARMVDRRQQLHVVRIVPAAIVVQGNLDHVGHRDEMPEERDPDLARQRLAVARHRPVHFLAGRGQGLGRRAQLHRHRVARVHVVDRERAAVLGAVGRVRGTRVIRDAGAVRRHEAALQAFFRDRRVRVGAVVAAEGDRRHVVGALDDDRQGCRRGIAVRIGQRIGENIIGGLVLPQGLHGGMALVGRIADQGIGVGTIFIQDQVAIGAMDDGAHAAADVRAQAVAGLDSRYGGRVDAQRIGAVSGPGIARFAIALDDVPHSDQGGILGHVGRVGDGGRRRIRDGRDDFTGDGTAQAVDHGDADGIGQVLPDGRVRGRASMILPAIGHVMVGDGAGRGIVAGQGEDAAIRIDDDGRGRCRRGEFGQGHRQ
ncbi:hypothetical protein CDEN61S_01535 [Castellaniella denitrificans]